MKNRVSLIQSLVAISVLVLLILVFVFRIRHEMEDFSVNFEAGKRLRVAETLYRTEDEHFQFKYLPASAILYAPLTLFPLPTAKAIWYGLILLCSGLMIFISYRLLCQSQYQARSYDLPPGRKLYIWLTPFLVLLKYFFREWELGQINTVVTVVLLLMIISLSKSEASSRSPLDSSASSKTFRWDVMAGIFWGMSVALKPYAALFLLYLIIKQKWKAVLSGVATLGVALLLPTYYYGFRGNWEVHKEWISSLSKSTPLLLSSQDNISLVALFQKWLGAHPLALWLAGIAIAVLAVIIFIMIILGLRQEQATFLEGTALLLCIPLVSPLGWDYTLIMGLPLLMIVVYHYPRYARPLRILLAVNLALIFFTFYDAMGMRLYKQYMAWSVPTLSFFLILGYGLYVRLRAYC
jgi:hypothetical protein